MTRKVRRVCGNLTKPEFAAKAFPHRVSVIDCIAVTSPLARYCAGFLALATLPCVSSAHMAEPRSHALIVAVSSFDDPALAPYALQGAERDGELMTGAFSQFAGENAETTLLQGSEANLANVRNQLGQLVRTAGSGERVMLYFSAHGSRIPDSGPLDEADGQDEVLLLADAREWDGSALPGALVDDELAQAVRDLRAKGVDVFLVIDSCASGGAMRSEGTSRARSLPASLFAVPETRMRSARRRDAAWVEDDMPAGSGRLVTFAASPTYDAAWDTPEGGLFTRSLAEALRNEPTDFVALAQDQRRQRALSPQPGAASEIGGAVETAFFFNGNAPDLLSLAAGLDKPDWAIGMHAAAQANCDPDQIGAPHALDPTIRNQLNHCDAVMLAVVSEEPGYFDAWYIDSAGQSTLLSPINGLYLDGRSPANLSFTFVARDPETGEPFPAGTDRLLLLRRSPAGERDAALTIEFSIG